MEATGLERELRESQAEQGRLVAALAALHSRVATPGAAGEPLWGSNCMAVAAVIHMEQGVIGGFGGGCQCPKVPFWRIKEESDMEGHCRVGCAQRAALCWATAVRRGHACSNIWG